MASRAEVTWEEDAEGMKWYEKGYDSRFFGKGNTSWSDGGEGAENMLEA